MSGEYTREAERLLPEKKYDGGQLITTSRPYNQAIDDCIPLVADLVKQIVELNNREELK